MEKITNLKELNVAILQLENKQAQESALLKDQFDKTYESLKPINLLRSTFKEIVSSPDIKEDLLKTSIGLASGYFSKKIVVGSTDNPVKQILGNLLQIGVTNVVSKNAEGIKSKFKSILSSIFEKNTK